MNTVAKVTDILFSLAALILLAAGFMLVGFVLGVHVGGVR